jgi:hypothetical protein
MCERIECATLGFSAIATLTRIYVVRRARKHLHQEA